MNVPPHPPGPRTVDVGSGEVARPGVFERDPPRRIGYPPRWVVLLGLVSFCAVAWAGAFWIAFQLI